MLEAYNRAKYYYLVDALKTLLTFSANVSIYDTFMDQREAQYDNFIEVLKVCGNDLSPSQKSENYYWA